MRPSWGVHLSALFYQDDFKSEGSNWKCNNNNVFIAETYKDEINEHTKQQRIEIIAVFMLIKNVLFFFLECGWQIKAIHTHTWPCHSSLSSSLC